LDEDELSAAFSRELSIGMESLMREISGGSGEALSAGEDDEEAQRTLKAAWEAMLVDGMDGMGNLPGLEALLGQDWDGGDSSTSAAGSGEANDFQSKIKQAMDKLKESESNLQVCFCSTANFLSGKFHRALPR
jgi:peroxin-19